MIATATIVAGTKCWRASPAPQAARAAATNAGEAIASVLPPTHGELAATKPAQPIAAVAT